MSATTNSDSDLLKTVKIDLSSCELNSIPKYIVKLTDLECLYLSKNLLKEISTKINT